MCMILLLTKSVETFYQCNLKEKDAISNLQLEKGSLQIPNIRAVNFNFDKLLNVTSYYDQS